MNFRMRILTIAIVVGTVGSVKSRHQLQTERLENAVPSAKTQLRGDDQRRHMRSTVRQTPTPVNARY